jgi:hypothetical protein
LRDFCIGVIFDFFNRIGHIRTWRQAGATAASFQRTDVVSANGCSRFLGLNRCPALVLKTRGGPKTTKASVGSPPQTVDVALGDSRSPQERPYARQLLQ